MRRDFWWSVTVIAYILFALSSASGLLAMNPLQGADNPNVRAIKNS